MILYDSLLAYCVEWLEGRAAASQTFFTCAYLHDLSLWEDAEPEGAKKLLVFSQLFLQLCHELLCQISRARVFDAEDFIPHLCGLSVEQPQGTLPLLRQTSEKYPFLTQLVSKMDPDNPSKAEDYRLQLVFRLLATMAGDVNALNQSIDVLKLFSTFPECTAQQQNPERFLDPSVLLPVGVLQPCLSHRTDPALHPGPRLKEPPLPRYIKYYSQMLVDLHLVCSSFNSGSIGLHRWIKGDGLKDLSLPARSLLETSNTSQIGVVIVQSFVAFGIPSEWIEIDVVQNFTSQLTTHYKPLLDVYAFNRARQRRAIGRALMGQLPVIQHLASAIDKKLQDHHKLLARKFPYPRYFESWAVDQTLQWMIRYIEEGILMDLFQGEELITSYWYLDYLYGNLLDLRQKLHALTKDLRESLLRLKSRTQQRAKRGGAGGRAAKQAPSTNIPSEAAIDLVTPAIHRLLCTASRQILFGIMRMNKLVAPVAPSPFVFSKRYRCFSRLPHPPMLEHRFYVETTQVLTQEQASSLLRLASQSFGSARADLSKLTQFPLRQDLLKVCISNSVQILSFEKIAASTAEKPARIEFLPECPYPQIFF